MTGTSADRARTDESATPPPLEGIPPRPVEADWLTLRRPADSAAREGTQRLMGRLWRALRSRPGADVQRPVHIIDIGAGTGANQEWLTPRLPFATRWTLLDHDATLLHHPVSTGTGRRVHGGLDALPALLAEEEWASVVTASALLDLLTHDELDSLATLLMNTGTPALFSLSVDGEVMIVPADEDDAAIAAAFDAHQRREALAGPSAAAHLAARLREAGAEVVEAATPWRLTCGQDDLVVRYLTDRAAAAVEHDPTLADRAEQWLDRRRRQCENRCLAVVVGHVDLLVLPPVQ